MRATRAMIAQRSPAAPFSMQMHGRKNWNAGQAKPVSVNQPDPFGPTLNANPASMK